MSVNTYQHSFEFLHAIEATIEHVVRAGQVPQINIYYHHRATLESGIPASFRFGYNRSTASGPPGLSALADTRIVTSNYQYKLVPVPDFEPGLEGPPVVASRADLQPARSFTGLSTPESTPPRPPNRAEDPRRCQSLTQKGAQCLRTPARARNVTPYGFYCWQHGDTGDIPLSSLHPVNRVPVERTPSFLPMVTPGTSARTSLSYPPQFNPPTRPHAVPSYVLASHSASSRAQSSTSRPVERLLTPSPEPQPASTLRSERTATDSAQNPFVQHHASQIRPSSPLRPLRLPQILGLSPQASTMHLVDNSPEQSPSSSPSPTFRRTHRASGSSSLSALGWPTTPARSGFRRESAIISAPEPEHERPASPVLPATAAPPTLSPAPSSAFSSSPSPVSSLTLSSIEPTVGSPTETPMVLPAITSLPSPLLSAPLSPTYSSASRPFVLDTTSFEPVQSFSRRASPAPRVCLSGLLSETQVIPDAEPGQPEIPGPAFAQAQQKLDPLVEEVTVTDQPSASQTPEQADAVAFDGSVQSKSFEFGKVGMGGSGTPEFSFQCVIPPGSKDELLSRRSHQANSSIVLPNEPASITDAAEQPLTRCQALTSTGAQGHIPNASPSPPPVQSPAAVPVQPTPAVQPEAIPISPSVSASLPFVSRLPRPSSTASLGRASLDGLRQRLQSHLPSRIPRLAAQFRMLPKSSENVASNAHLRNEGVNKGTSRRRSTLGRCSLASVAESCPRAARRSEGSTKPIDFFIRNGTERFSDYIPQDLSPGTQDKLRVRMQQAPTGSAAKGYIYAFEIASMSTDNHICVKLGRTTDPEEPLRQWRSQCPSSQIKLGGVWPTSATQADKAAGGVSSAQMIDYCSTLEDLVRLELGDIAQYDGHSSGRRTSSKFSAIKCKDCSSRHNDIYRIKRHRGSDGKTDWDLLGDIVQGWAGFVTRYCEHPQAPRRVSS
ncbi:hypothetical protein BDV93DRAFT_524442 [Ceratobasidium sp. AG-I]|nr:hypothetical protein BDV93DRAFT_524442 [Ceratobasidium sp. AG-I]